jgi:predicted DNA-binding transcriptional regulator
MQEILQNIGLSPNETKIYLALVKTGEMSVAEISSNTGIHRRNIYDTLDRLLEKGLVFVRASESENRYSPVDPNKLLEIVSEKRQGIEKILPTLEKEYKNQISGDQVYILKGIEGQKNIFRLVIEAGKDSYFVGAKGGWFDPRLDVARDNFFFQANKKKINFIQLFDAEVIKNLPNFPKHFPGKLKYRILPKAFSTNSVIHIFGDYVVTYTGLSVGVINNDVTFFVMKSHTLAQSYRTWFEFMWKMSKSVD